MKIPPSTHSPIKPRRTRKSQPHWRQASLGLILALLTAGSSFAVTKTWNNTSGNTDWNTASFWTATGVPGSGDIVQFTGAAVASPNISASTTITTLISDATASGYTLSANSGQSLTLLSAGSGGASVINFQNTTGTNTISANLILGQAAAATATFNQISGGTLVFSGDISSTNAIAGLFLVAQGSTTLSGNNTYSGITTLIGTLNINSATAISSGSLLASANVVLANTSGAAITLTNNNNITLNNTLTFTSAATTGDLNFGSGVATVSGAGRTILVTNDGSTLKIGSLDADTTARTLTIGTSATAPTATFGKLSIANAAGANLQGTINFAGGVLEIGNKSALGTGTILWMTDHNSLGVKTFQASTDLTGANAVANPMQLAENGNNLGPAIIGGTHAIEFSGTLTPNGNARTLTINNTALTTFSGDVKLPTVGVFSLTINGSGNMLISGAISPITGSTSAGLTYAGTGKLTLSNSGNTYSGATTVNSGTIAYGANQATPSASATVINATAASGAATFDLAGYDSTINTLTFGGTTAGANATNTLSTGAGTLTLGGNVTYTKATLDANDPGTATLSGKLDLGATRTFAIADSTNTTNELALSSIVSGTGFGITKTGTGTLTLSGTNTYTGVTTITAGTLSVGTIGNGGVAGNLGQATNVVGNIVFDGGTLQYTGANATSDRTFTINTGKTAIIDTTNNLSLVGATGTATNGALTKVGAGTLTLTGVSTNTGATTVSAGTLAYGVNQATATASNVTINATTASDSATFDLTGYNATINNITFGGTTAGANATNTLSTGAGTLTLGTNNISYIKATLDANDPGTATLSGNLSFGGTTRTFLIADSTNTINELNVTAVISGTGGLAKAQAGTLTLSGANTYTGATSIQQGILSINSIGNVSGGASALGAPTTGANGTIAFGTSALTGQLTYTGGASTTDRVINLSGTTGGGIIDQSGTGLLKFTSNLTANGAGIKTLTLQGSTAGTGEIGGIIRDNSGANTTSLVKAGTSTWALSGANSYTGTTTVTAGTLLINGSGTINNTSSIAINAATAKLNYQSSTALNRTVTVTNGGTFAYNSSANYSGALTLTNGKLGGTNWNGNLANLTIGANQTIAPGNSPGTATTTTQTWADGGSYDWEINRATGGTPGTDPGWDLVNLTTNLDITATTGIRFTINMISLTLSNVSGAAAGFNSATDYQWVIADSASAITSFSADKFALNLTAFANPYNGTFAIARGDEFGVGGDNTQLFLTYTAAVPEPSSFALLAVGLATLMTFRRRLRTN